MRKVLILIAMLFFSSLSVSAQNAPFELKKEEGTGEVYYEEVVQAQNMKQADLYQRAKSWIISNFKTADNNINFDEKEFSIVNAGALKLNQKKTMTWAVYDGTIDFKFHFWAKEGKYKFRIDNIMFHVLCAEMPEGKTVKTKTYTELGKRKIDSNMKDQCDEKFPLLVAAFKNGMSSEPKKENKDW
jgi:Domain of unknown function (DUF4468) with TBP-like fold